MVILNAMFTMNQKIVLGTVTFAALWAALSLVVATLMGLQSIFALVIFETLTIFAWILIPLYFKQRRVAYILGIILLVVESYGLFAGRGNPPWYTFVNPISIIKDLLFVLISIAGVYFSYTSFIENASGETFNE